MGAQDQNHQLKGIKYLKIEDLTAVDVTQGIWDDGNRETLKIGCTRIHRRRRAAVSSGAEGRSSFAADPAAAPSAGPLENRTHQGYCAYTRVILRV